MASNLIASLLLVVMPGAPSSFLLLLVRHLLLVAMPFVTSVLAPNSDEQTDDDTVDRPKCR